MIKRYNNTNWGTADTEIESAITNFINTTSARDIHIRQKDGSIVRAWIDATGNLALFFQCGTFKEQRADIAARKAAIEFIQKYDHN